MAPASQSQVVTKPSALAGELEAERAMVDRSGLRGEVVAATASLKVAIAEFYMSNGQWPGNLGQLGLGNGNFAGKWLSSVELGPGGQIRLERHASRWRRANAAHSGGTGRQPALELYFRLARCGPDLPGLRMHAEALRQAQEHSPVVRAGPLWPGALLAGFVWLLFPASLPLMLPDLVGL